MKSYFSFIIVSLALVFTSCGKDDNDQHDDTIIGKWNLIQVTGGFAGVNCSYGEGVSVWTFDASTLTIVNDFQNMEPLCDGVSLPDMTVSYGILTQNGKMFLVLAGNEQGEITLSGDQFELDQNSYSTGQGADGFGYTFKR